MDRNEKRVLLVEQYLEQLGLGNKLFDHYRNRVILVTGGAGAIGSNLVIALSQLVGDKGKVIILDNLSAIKGTDPWNVVPLPTSVSKMIAPW